MISLPTAAARLTNSAHGLAGRFPKITSITPKISDPDEYEVRPCETQDLRREGFEFAVHLPGMPFFPATV